MARLTGIDPAIRTLALTNHSAFLKRAVTVTHKRAAELLGISPATESEYATEHLERCCQVLAAYGLEVVPKGAQLPPEQQRAFITLAMAHMERTVLETQAQETGPGELGER